ncbi:SHC-transforming 4 [Pelobates cultripes]|uniref:SHC-transforming 4 n=1 Tax=Pelobates cultripes TaxID=61616 RepID=A0AAD1VXS6_PELCU|nr:SHC-transforming 4 [Pelobates cultripes]
MREHGLHRGGILHETVFTYPVMLQRSKYSRFRNDSLTSTEDGTQSVSLNAKAGADCHTSATSSLPLDSIALVTPDTSTTLCTLIPKMSHFKISSPVNLLGFKHFSLGAKETSKVKLPDNSTLMDQTTSAETALNSSSQATLSRQGVEMDANTKNQNDCLLMDIEKPPLAKRQTCAQQIGRNNGSPGLSYYVICFPVRAQVPVICTFSGMLSYLIIFVVVPPRPPYALTTKLWHAFFEAYAFEKHVLDQLQEKSIKFIFHREYPHCLIYQRKTRQYFGLPGSICVAYLCYGSECHLCVITGVSECACKGPLSKCVLSVMSVMSVMTSVSPKVSVMSVLMRAMTCVHYMGCIEVLQSMRSLDFGTRTQVTREAISRLCEAVPGAKGTTKKRKPPLKFLSSVLGKSNLQFSGMNVTLTISTNSLILTNVDTKQVVANHHMQSISFASGGDPDTTDYVAYVAKDPVNQRACHILECLSSKAQEVISTIGHAFELRFKQYLKSPSFIDSSDSDLLNINNATQNVEVKGHDYYNEIPGKVPPAGGVLDKRIKIDIMEPMHIGDDQNAQSVIGFHKSTNIYENCRENPKIIGHSNQNTLNIPAGKEELFDDPSYINTASKIETFDKNQTFGKHNPTSVKVKCALDTHAAHRSVQVTARWSVCRNIRVRLEDWYHGKMSRKIAENLLINDGDFLVRESTTSACQYVLSGLHGGQHKHLLLVDPEGKVRTKDHIFENVSHLIKYHVENKLPIISSGSELCLRHPVTMKDVCTLKD